MLTATHRSAALREGISGGNQLFRNINSNASANFDADEQTVRGALAYHFWSGGNGGYGG